MAKRLIVGVVGTLAFFSCVVGAGRDSGPGSSDPSVGPGTSETEQVRLGNLQLSATCWSGTKGRPIRAVITLKNVGKERIVAMHFLVEKERNVDIQVLDWAEMPVVRFKTGGQQYLRPAPYLDPGAPTLEPGEEATVEFDLSKAYEFEAGVHYLLVSKTIERMKGGELKLVLAPVPFVVDEP